MSSELLQMYPIHLTEIGHLGIGIPKIRKSDDAVEKAEICKVRIALQWTPYPQFNSATPEASEHSPDTPSLPLGLGQLHQILGNTTYIETRHKVQMRKTRKTPRHLC